MSTNSLILTTTMRCKMPVDEHIFLHNSWDQHKFVHIVSNISVNWMGLNFIQNLYVVIL